MILERRTFSGRSGRVIATSRALLAVVFLLALWLDPIQPIRSDFSGYLTLSAYLIWSAALVIIAWESWWWDYRLARAIHVIDMTGFITAVYFTETTNGDFSSPFTAFSAFLLIRATIQWGWRGTAITAATLVGLNLTIGGGLVALGMDIDPYRFGRRTMYMLILSLIMIWLGLEQRIGRNVGLPEARGIPGERRDAVLSEALAHGRFLFGARGGAIAFTSGEEPWVEIERQNGDDIRKERLGPEELAEDLGSLRGATLFDRRRGRLIELVDDRMPEPISGPVHLPIAARYGIDEGLVFTIVSAAGTSQMVLWGIPAMSVDDLAMASSLAREIGAALDREEMASMARSTAVSDIRNSVARDLHDSVAQFLAGTLFRLEALRRWIRDGHDPEGEINAIKDALRREQGQLRILIDRLRRGEDGDRKTDLVEELTTLLEEIGSHWHIRTRLHVNAGPMPVSIQLAHELRQVVREAVANAVRHGRCQQVDLTLGQEHDLLKLEISDDGIGFPQDGGSRRPRSISERIDALGGRLALGGSGAGARLDIELPIRIAA
jgi:signal transduction histidine kinase